MKTIALVVLCFAACTGCTVCGEEQKLLNVPHESRRTATVATNKEAFPIGTAEIDSYVPVLATSTFTSSNDAHGLDFAVREN
jgi:hypothetical protein